MGYDYALGIDIAKDTIEVKAYYVATETSLADSQTFANTQSGYESLNQWLQEHGVNPVACLVIMEATGVYWEACAFYFHESGYPVSVVNPAQVKAFAKTIMRRGKTDALDADLIARFGFKINPRLWQPPTLEMEYLSQLFRQRDTYVDMRTQVKNQLHSLERRAHASPVAIKTLTETVAFFTQQIQQLEIAFKEQLATNAEWQAHLDRLMTIGGVGFVTATAILTETRAFDNFYTDAQASAYAGLTPAPFQSGTSVHKKEHISKMGNIRLRRALYLAAVSSIRCNPVLKEFYQRLRENGKPAKVALIAVARKILRISFILIKKRAVFDPEYSKKVDKIEKLS